MVVQESDEILTWQESSRLEIGIPVERLLEKRKEKIRKMLESDKEFFLEALPADKNATVLIKEKGK